MKAGEKNYPAREAHQKRGHQRRQSLLDAAEALIVETGLEGFAMAEVAKRAGAAHGSLYQFFPSRAALLKGLHLRHMDRLQEAVAKGRQTLVGLKKSPGPQAFLDAYLEPLKLFLSQNPSYRLLRLGMPVAGTDAEADLDNDVIAELTDMLSSLIPHSSENERRHAAMILLEVADALVILGTSQQVAAEARTLLRLYLNDLIERFAE
ncbi:MAG: TetR/AcrR family transcriptional regulator [Pseudomonadota bacterium]